MLKKMNSVLIILCCLTSPALAGPLMTTTEPPPEETPCVPGDERPRCLFDFDQDGKVKTESGVAERTFDFPPLKIGFIFDVNHKAVFPHAAIQLVEWEMFGEIFATNFGASWNRVFVDLSWSAIPLMYIGPTIFAGYNIGEKDWSAGIGVNILRF